MSLPAIFQGVTGLAGLFGRKTSPYERESAAQLAQQREYNRRLWELAQRYDPAKEDAAAIQYGQDVAGHAYKNALGSTLQKYGRNPGDTNVFVDLQRQTDDVLNPLAGQAANLASSRFQRKMGAYQAAMGSASPGDLAGQYMQLGRQAGGQDTTAAQMLLGQSIDSIFKKKTTNPLVKTPGTLGGTSVGNTGYKLRSSTLSNFI